MNALANHGFSTSLKIDRLPNFMPGIAPITTADAALFAGRYLVPSEQAAFVADHKDGDTLVHWWPKLDADTKHTIFVDCLLGDSRLPYDERLETVDRNPIRNTYLTKE